MKKYLVTIVIMCLLLGGCGSLKKPPNSGKVIKASINQSSSSKYDFEGSELSDEEKDEYLSSTGKTIIKWYLPDSAAVIDPTLTVAINKRLEELNKEFAVDFLYESNDKYIEKIDNYLFSTQAPDIITTGYAREGEINRIYYAYNNEWFEVLGELPTSYGMFKNVPEFMYTSSAIDGQIIGLGSRLPVATNYSYEMWSDLKMSHNPQLGQKKVPVSQLEQYFEADENKEIIYFFNDGNLYPESYIDGLSNYCDPITGDKYKGIVIDYSKDGKAYNLFEDDKAIDWFKSIYKLKKSGHYTNDFEQANIFICKENERDNGTFDMNNQSIDRFLMATVSNNKNSVWSSRTTRVMADCYVEPQKSITGVCKNSSNKELAIEAFYTIMNDTIINNYLLFGIPGRDCTLGVMNCDSSYREGTIEYFGNPYVALQDSHYQAETELAEYYKEMPVYEYRYVDLSGYSDQLKKQEEIVDEYISGLLSGEYDDVDAVLSEASRRLKQAGVQEVIDYINN